MHRTTETAQAQSPTTTHVDAVVIGSGLAGLTTAAGLAAHGHSVVVLEQYSVVGGSTHVFRRKGTWEWEVGVHHLADCGFGGDMPTILRGFGIGPDQLTFRRMADNGYERLVFPDLVFDTPTDWSLYVARLVEAFPHDEKRIRRFMRIVRRVGEAVDRGPATASASGVARAAREMGVAAPLAALPLKRVFDLFGIDPRMQTLMSVSPCGSINAPPSRLPFAAFCVFYERFVRGGSWFPEGGGQMLSATLLQALEHLGGTVLTNESVEEILVDGGAVHGVRTASGRTFSSPLVVSTADVKKTYAELLPAGAVPHRDLDRVDDYRMSQAFFNAFIGVDVDLAAQHPNRDHFSMPTWTTYDEMDRLTAYREGESAEAWLERVEPIAPAYVHVSNLKDPHNQRYAPQGSSSLEVMLPIGCDYRLWSSAPARTRGHEYRDEDDYQYLKQGLTAAMIDRATTVFPEIDGHVVHQEAATPLTQERFTQSTAGASYGIELNTRQFSIRRPGPRTSVKGLFLSGASCRPGPTTEGVLHSGIQTVDAITGSNLLADFRQGRALVAPGTLPNNDQDWDALEYSRVGSRRSRSSDDADAETS
ncbi:hypothetical protein ASD11_09630 [Aeromicrobium sp. Root495]|uniref:phytoene desaturase family protein n=1 Tax=Aeromicrobium sp. Root495 TaxID=1736550 RepID=UPI0006FDD284|nr:NAD(P)/FAD-dependent oxidoreductase [Aeromicrobium sp. Root495]KQY59786.1 hypothetical protein ASD11_09630 [Aeromicrobium sp. Root495]